MKNRKATRIGFHTAAWILFFSLIIAFVSSSEIGNVPRLLSPSFLLFVAVYLSLFYFNAYILLPRFYLSKKFVFYFGCIFILLLLIYYLKPFDRLVLLHGDRPPLHDRRPPDFLDRQPGRGPRGRGGQELDIVSIVLFLAVWSASSVLQILQQWRTTERRAIQAEADKAVAELSFLKAQVNPHFLFNTLNNIYSLAITKSDHTPDAILKLSNILRYVTDDAQHNVVPLQNEIDCAGNYIELQKLRLSKKVEVQFLVTGATVEKTIAPLLFMTFIENAFKYGVSNHEDCIITIKIASVADGINLFCRNKIIRKEVEEREGVGIKNAKKRLSFLYPEKHLLKIDTENNHFIVNLFITT
ncbi:MAG: hypothetical protein JWR72_921 [Flavisolibacter sp.]|nr:hypothetical protein [Flavisolibacter sp.]